jgi:asparagine synthase (glutamine-hydrolysing)
VQKDIQSFTLSFPDTPYDEAPLARRVAEATGTKHTEVPLRGTDMLMRLDEAVSALDQPSMDGINTYFVSWAARELGLKVALSGLGGDEIFAGYRTFTDTPRLARLGMVSRFVPDAFRRISQPLVGSLVASRGTPDAARKASDAWLMPNTLPHPYFFTRLLFPPSELLRLTEPRFRNSAIASDGVTLDPTWLAWLERAADQAREFEPIAGVSWLELRTYLASTLLHDTDSVSMARSLEVRVPLLDTPLVEFMCALPDEARVRPGAPKALLRAALNGLLPEQVFRQSKRTFTLPWEDWMRTSLKPRIETSFANLAPALAPHLHANGVQTVWNNFLRSETTWSRPWSLYVLNQWCRRHLS